MNCCRATPVVRQLWWGGSGSTSGVWVGILLLLPLQACLHSHRHHLLLPPPPQPPLPSRCSSWTRRSGSLKWTLQREAVLPAALLVFSQQAESLHPLCKNTPKSHFWFSQRYNQNWEWHLNLGTFSPDIDCSWEKLEKAGRTLWPKWYEFSHQSSQSSWIFDLLIFGELSCFFFVCKVWK